MADDSDRANDIIDNAVHHALNKIRENAPQNAKGARFCIECGDPIQIARTKLGFKRCIRCAEHLERQGKLFA